MIITVINKKNFLHTFWLHSIGKGISLDLHVWQFMMTSSNGNMFRVTGPLWPVTSGFPSLRPVTRSFEAFFDLRLSKWLSKQLRRRWLETSSRSLWCHCNVCYNLEGTPLPLKRINYLFSIIIFYVTYWLIQYKITCTLFLLLFALGNYTPPQKISINVAHVSYSTLLYTLMEQNSIRLATLSGHSLMLTVGFLVWYNDLMLALLFLRL